MSQYPRLEDMPAGGGWSANCVRIGYWLRMADCTPAPPPIQSARTDCLIIRIRQSPTDPESRAKSHPYLSLPISSTRSSQFVSLRFVSKWGREDPYDATVTELTDPKTTDAIDTTRTAPATVPDLGSPASTI